MAQSELIFLPNKLRACRNVELHEVIREYCPAGVFARFDEINPPFLNCCRGKEARGEQRQLLRDTLSRRHPSAKAFASASTRMMSPTILRRCGGIQRERSQGLPWQPNALRSNPFANRGDVVCGFLWAILRKHAFELQAAGNPRRYSPLSALPRRRFQCRAKTPSVVRAFATAWSSAERFHHGR